MISIKDVRHMTKEEKETIKYSDIEDYINKYDDNMVFLLLTSINNPKLLIEINNDKLAIKCLKTMNISKKIYDETLAEIVSNLDNKTKLNYVDGVDNKIAFLKNIDNQTKMKQLENEKDFNKATDIISSIDDDNILLTLFFNMNKYFSNINYQSLSYLAVNIVTSLNSDSNKEYCLREFYNPADIAYIVASYKDDNIKLEYINDPKYTPFKCTLIAGLNDIKLLTKFVMDEKDFNTKEKIVKEVKDTNNKEILNKVIENQKYRNLDNGDKIYSTTYLKSLNKEEQKKISKKDMTKYYKNNNDYANYEMIIQRTDDSFFESIKNSGLRYECIMNSNIDIIKRCVYLSDLLVNETKKHFESIDKEEIKKIFQYRLMGASYDKLLDAISTCKKEDLIYFILLLNNDESKEKYLSKLDNVFDELRVIVGFQNDKTKEKYLNNPRYSKYKIIIIASMTNAIEYSMKNKISPEELINGTREIVYTKKGR